MEAQEHDSIVPSGTYVAHDHIYLWIPFRAEGTVRHEIFFGSANRKKSIKYKLYVFISPKDHNMSRYGVHNIDGHEFDMHLKKVGQVAAMKAYDWSIEDFRKVFGKSYL